jgi:glycosidase
VQELGVDVIWLLSYYPSLLRDDGYDIADYWNIPATAPSTTERYLNVVLPLP